MEQDSPPGKRRRVALLLRLGAALVAVLLSTAGCGLPDAYYLSPPNVPAPTGSLVNSFVILPTDHSSEPDFRGYELYYKLYSPATPPVADQNLGTAATTSTTTVDALMTASGFLTLCRGPVVSAPATALPQAVAQDTSSETRNVPLILIDPSDRGSSFSITINFNPVNQLGNDSTTNYTYTAPTGAYQQEIDRDVDGTISGVQRCMPFTLGQGYYKSTDPDIVISGINSSTIQGTVVYIAVYAVSYGLQNLSTPIWSYPVYMGYLELTTSFSP